MNGNLIYIGDTVRFEQKSLSNISNINGVYRVLTSTLESTINSNVSIAFSRLDIKFRLKQEKYYSDWYKVNDLETSSDYTYSNVFVDVDKSLDIETEFVLKTTPSNWDEDADYINVSNVKVDTIAQPSKIKNEEYRTTEAVVSSVGRQNSISYVNNFTYKPYDIKPAENLYDDLSYIANQIYGHEVEYVKVRSNSKKGKDFIFREWNLYNVSNADVKCLKVLVPNNEFPDNKFNFSPFGVDYGDVFEIHIIDSYFKQIYGDFFPQERDFLYFPLLDRIYEIKSTYLFRAFNMNPSYWKCTLIKWEDKQNIVYEDTSIIDKIRDASIGLEEAFNTEVTEESKNLLNTSQLGRRLGNSDFRVYLDSTLKFKEDILDTDYTMFSNSQYDLNSLYSKFDTSYVAVKYPYVYSQKQNENRTLFMWVKPDKVLNNTINCTVSGGPTYTVTLNVGNFADYFEIGSLISLYKKGSPKTLKTTMKIISISSDRTTLTANLYDTLLDNFNLADLELVSRSIERELLVSGTDTYIKEEKRRTFTKLPNNTLNGIRTFILDSNLVGLEYFGIVYTFKLDSSLKDSSWYGLVISLNNTNKEITLYVYERYEEQDKVGLNEVYLNTKFSVSNIDRVSDKNLYLVGSSISLTNVRLVSELVEADLHGTYLTTSIIRNDSKCFIVDNAIRNNDYEIID